MSYLKPISTLELSNLSGLLQIYLARSKDILSFPRIIGGKVQGDITFQPGAGWIRWDVIQSSDSFSANSMDTMEGVGKNQQLPFNLPSRSIQETTLEEMEKDSFVILFVDANLKNWLFGTPDRPIQFRYTSGTGTTGSGRNDYRCLFYSEHQYNKAEYTGSITEADPKVVIRYNDLGGEVLASLGAGESITFDGEFDYSEVILPAMTTNQGEYAIINYTKDGSPVSAQVELGKTVIIISDFTPEFTLP